MRPNTKLKIARRKHTLELLKWLYSRREKQLDGTKLSLQHRRSEGGGVDRTRSLTYGEVRVAAAMPWIHYCRGRGFRFSTKNSWKFVGFYFNLKCTYVGSITCRTAEGCVDFGELLSMPPVLTRHCTECVFVIVTNGFRQWSERLPSLVIDH